MLLAGQRGLYSGKRLIPLGPADQTPAGGGLKGDGAADSAAAVERILRFLAGAESVFERVDDSSGSVQEVYHAAAEAGPSLAAKLADDQKVRLPSQLNTA